MISLLFSIPQWLRIALSLIYLTIVASLSLLPPNDFPDIPLFPGTDKIVHTCMYLGLAFLACWCMHAEAKHKWYYIVTLFSIGWGITMEIFQFLMHLGRSFDILDIVSNSIGTLIGVSIYILMAQLKKNIDSNRAGLQ